MSLLIESEMLATLLNDDKVILLDTRFSLSNHREGRALYEQGHIPGALYADLETDLSGDIIPGQTGRHPQPEMATFTDTLRRWGVTENSHVIVYDDGGHAMAARAWWLLRWAGIKTVSLLHGGIKAWLAGRYPMTSSVPEKSASDLVPTYGGMATVSAQEIMSALGQGQMILIDARGEERFRGEVEPLDAKAGHIPGAICHPFANNMDEQGRFLSSEVLRQQFSGLIGSNQTPVFYCGSGVTACHNIFAMAYAGLDNAVLYPGSWSEWIVDDEHPISVGA